MDSGNGCQGVGLVELEFATKGSQDLGCVGAGCVCEQSLVRELGFQALFTASMVLSLRWSRDGAGLWRREEALILGSASQS